MSESLVYRLVHAAARALAVEMVKKAPSGWVVTIKPPTRSLEQNALLHARLGEISKRVEWYGVKRSPKAWKRIFAASLFDHDLIPGLEPGSLVLVERLTREMNVKELTLMLDLVEAFAAQHGVVFRDQAEAA